VTDVARRWQLEIKTQASTAPCGFVFGPLLEHENRATMICIRELKKNIRIILEYTAGAGCIKRV
jgi:hypothetical protein